MGPMDPRVGGWSPSHPSSAWTFRRRNAHSAPRGGCSVLPGRIASLLAGLGIGRRRYQAVCDNHRIHLGYRTRELSFAAGFQNEDDQLRRPIGCLAA